MKGENGTDWKLTTHGCHSEAEHVSLLANIPLLGKVSIYRIPFQPVTNISNHATWGTWSPYTVRNEVCFGLRFVAMVPTKTFMCTHCSTTTEESSGHGSDVCQPLHYILVRVVSSHRYQKSLYRLNMCCTCMSARARTANN